MEEVTWQKDPTEVSIKALKYPNLVCFERFVLHSAISLVNIICHLYKTACVSNTLRHPGKV